MRKPNIYELTEVSDQQRHKKDKEGRVNKTSIFITWPIKIFLDANRCLFIYLMIPFFFIVVKYTQ